MEMMSTVRQIHFTGLYTVT